MQDTLGHAESNHLRKQTRKLLDDQTICLAYNNDTYFFYKQPVYKQLAFGWQIANQLLGFKPLSLTNSKNYR